VGEGTKSDMKKLMMMLLAGGSLTCAYADFVVKKQIQSAAQNGIITFRVSGDKTRLDMPTELLGEVSVIRYLNTGQTITMIHRQKKAKMESGDEYKKKLEEIHHNSAPGPKLVDTGKIEKVGG
jgi:hypothetical protein